MKVPSYNKANRKAESNYTQLPKGNYVCKIMKVEQATYKNGKSGLKISFDIAEGEYKDFYSNKYREDDREDKKWSNDAIYWLSIPYDDCEGYIQDGWDTFWANVEDSNNGYVFTGDEKTVKGKVFGGIFRIEQTEYNGRIYDHTRLNKTRIAQDVRDGKITYVPKDKLISQSSPSGSSDDFIAVPEGPVDLPF